MGARRVLGGGWTGSLASANGGFWPCGGGEGCEGGGWDAEAGGHGGELVAQAREQGLQLSGEGGLLQAESSPLGLLSELVTDRLSHLPPGALRPSDLDALLVTERIFGPLGAAIQAGTFIVLATHPDLRAEEDRLEAAEAALDDGVEPDDPRVEELAVQRCAHLVALNQAIEAAGLDAAEEKIFEIYDADLKGEEGTAMSAATAITKMPYDFSPARMRCVELAGRLFGEALADAHSAAS